LAQLQKNIEKEISAISKEYQSKETPSVTPAENQDEAELQKVKK